MAQIIVGQFEDVDMQTGSMVCSILIYWTTLVLVVKVNKVCLLAHTLSILPNLLASLT